MKENSPRFRPGAGCEPNGDAVEAEVLPPGYFPEQQGALRVGRVHFDRRTTLESPCFWILVGGAGVGLMVYFAMKEKRRS